MTIRHIHRYQLRLIRGMLARKLRLAVGWEKFDWRQQGLLDEWERQKISQHELLQRTDFQSNWGVYSSMDSEILLVTTHSRIRNVALNAPPELARKVVRGEDSLALDEQLMPDVFVRRIPKLCSADWNSTRNGAA